MKNQYFGDNRDLFKYDLVLHIIQAGLVDYFTFIPMLTKSDATKHGGKTIRSEARVGIKNKELLSFLDDCVKENRRDIKQLEGFFKKKAIPMTIYGEDFSHAGRWQYFQKIGPGLLSKSLILVDPDIGMEVGRSTEKHILYSEVKDLYRRMGESSILMIYQHFPPENHLEYLLRMSRELEDRIIGEEPICIDDNEIIFFFLTKDESLEHSLTHVIKDYAERYS